MCVYYVCMCKYTYMYACICAYANIISLTLYTALSVYISLSDGQCAIAHAVCTNMNINQSK